MNDVWNPKKPTQHRGRTSVRAWNGFTSSWDIYIIFPNATDAAYYVRKLQSQVHKAEGYAEHNEIIVRSENGVESVYQFNIFEPYGDPCWKRIEHGWYSAVEQQFHPLLGITNA